MPYNFQLSSPVFYSTSCYLTLSHIYFCTFISPPIEYKLQGGKNSDSLITVFSLGFSKGSRKYIYSMSIYWLTNVWKEIKLKEMPQIKSFH